ncbi:hypothetical protein HHK36_022651 [Tetracentron sinense]|uniref:Uncharacterized protein n=1 Tax=Tetracentron sinense TaxID=13715 RepID=A0A834YN97_TETSI|nr:hypothetical protein HHK36_022651 [Tetracentron sinense]
MELRSEEQSQLQLVEREEVDDEEDLFEAIDKCKLSDRFHFMRIEFGKLFPTYKLDFASSPFIAADFLISSVLFRFLRNFKWFTSSNFGFFFIMPAFSAVISQGINAGDVKKLQDAGIYTCNGLMMHTKKNLTGIKGLSEAKVDKICEAAEKLVNFGYITGSDVLLKRKSVVRITTGSNALDELLGGGIETLAITEAFGEFRSGKTQLAHTLCVSTQLPTSMHGGNGKVAYIDTEGTFRPDRIVPIAERFGMDAVAVLDNIIYARAYTYEHQYNLILGLAAKMSEEPFKLLIVDSIIALFRVDFTGRGELAERQQKLAQMLSRLTKIAEEFNVAVYMTNQVIADPGGGMFISDPKKPAGGHVLAHAATVRLMFRKGKGEQRVCKVFDAPNLPEAEAISSTRIFFSLTPG